MCPPSLPSLFSHDLFEETAKTKAWLRVAKLTMANWTLSACNILELSSLEDFWFHYFVTLVVFQCQTDLTIWMQNPRCGLAPAFSVGGNLVKVLFRFLISPLSIALKPRKASCRGGNLSASQRDPRNSNVFWSIQSLCFSICLNQGQRHLSRLVVAGVFSAINLIYSAQK